ncbi:hypothetical protein WMY93_002945 [Mugilogobius chulae]|uniref:Uncharacterized protein n=1 Tax=Mugilogobius chulae TaxID=88201 RepID=A0AAW0PY36_9GOBI
MLKGEDGKAVACNIKAQRQQQQERERAAHEELRRREEAKQREELARLQQLEACRRRQEEELHRVEVEKERALELQRREKELREKLLCNLLKKSSGKKSPDTQEQAGQETSGADDLIMGVLSRVNGLKPEKSVVVQNVDVKKSREGAEITTKT